MFARVFNFDRYTIPEKLGLANYSCKACQQQVVKQLSFKQLPPVLSIQLKRFEHTSTSSSKIETRVKVPMVLDMTSYMTRSVKVRGILTKSGVKRTANAISTEFNY